MPAISPGRLPVVFRIAAGLPADRPLAPGEAMEISTGGAVPEGADAVVPIEHVVQQTTGSKSRIQSLPERTCVRPEATFVPAIALLEAGTLLGAAQIGALAAAGVAEVLCARRPTVVVLSTGTELRSPGDELGPGQIYESNGPMLAAAFEAAGALVERIGPIADDEESHRAALERGLAADVLVSSGGVSVGPHDLVRRILAELGVEEDFWGVAVRPGKPLAFGSRGATLVFGLPGNPVSALVAVELFVRPALLALQGAARPGPRWESARLAPALRETRARRARPRTDARRSGRGGARAAHGPGVAHDRASGRGRRARARSGRRGRASGGRAGPLPPARLSLPGRFQRVGSSPGADTAIGFA